MCLLSPLELVLFLEELEEWESLDVESRDDPSQSSHTSCQLLDIWRLLGGFILVIVDTFSGLGLIPRWETIYPSNFPDGTLKVHF
jgi:hypothetical protein